MNLPDQFTERFPFLYTLEEDWQPVARWALAGWLVFYVFFFIRPTAAKEPSS